MSDRRVGRNNPCPCGSGRKFKHCCLNRVRTVAPRPAPMVSARSELFGYAGAVGAPFSTGSATRSRPEPEESGSPTPPVSSVKVLPIEVGLDYTYPEPFGNAEVTSIFPAGKLYLLADSHPIMVDYLEPGMQALLQDGGVATITAVRHYFEPPDPPILMDNGLRLCRVVGTIKHKGPAVVDVTWPGYTGISSPDHRYYSFSRKTWVPAQELQVGEFLRGDNNLPVSVQSVSKPRWGMCDLYNVEVEHCHTFFVGKGNGASVLVHNGDASYISKLLRMEDGTPIPRGFATEAEYRAFVARLRGELPAGVEPVVQGSSVTGFSFRTGRLFDVGRISDLDIALVGDDLFARASAMGLRVKDGTRIGPLLDKALSDLGLSALQRELSVLAGRPVNFMLFDSLLSAFRRAFLMVPPL